MAAGDDRELGAPRGRLVSTGGLLADLVLRVEQVPGRGEDVLASGFEQTVGGGFAVLAAAARLGVPTLLAGVLGSDAIASAARAALAGEGIELLIDEPRPGPSGVCVVLVDDGGERTMVTVEGVEGRLAAADLARIEPAADDVVYVSGYELLYPHGEALAAWIAEARPPVLIFDPGPLIAEIEPARLEAVLSVSRWLSLNAAEAEALTGVADPAAAAAAALERGSELAGVVARRGAEGCLLLERGCGPLTVAAFPAEAVDTTTAGDVHVGAFAAALLRGLEPASACRWANAAASVVVAQAGQSSPPRLPELCRILGEDVSGEGRRNPPRAPARR